METMSFACLFRFLVFSLCLVLKQLHMCCLINIMLLPLAIPFTFLTLSMLPNIVSYQNFAFVDAHFLEHPIIFHGGKG